MSAEEFNKFWEFDDGQEVVIKHSRPNKEFLRSVKGEIDWDGNQNGPKAVWKTSVNDEIVQFQNAKTGEYLRVDGDGKGWKTCENADNEHAKFTLERYGKGSAILRTVKEFENEPCLGSKNGDPRPVTIYIRGEKQEFSTPFNIENAGKRRVIIQRSFDCNQLRAKKDEVELNKNGGCGEPAQWKIICEDGKYQFKNIKTKGFLRLDKDGKEVDSEGDKDDKTTLFEIEAIFEDLGQHLYIKSCKTGNYIGVGAGGKVKGVDGQNEKSRLAIFEANEDDE